MMETYYRCYTNISLKAIGMNINEVKKNVDEGTLVLAVVKANAYGHGAIQVSTYLHDRVDYFGVATIEEAIEIREAGVRKPILILGYTSPNQYEQVINYDVTQTIYTYEDGVLLDETAARMGKTGKFHIAIDTGMTRIGFRTGVEIEESVSQVEKLSKLKNATLEGVFTHFACADMKDKTHFNGQKRAFEEFLDKCKDKNIDIPIKHAANSATIMECKEMQLNMVRSGIVTYGLYPSEEVDKTVLKLEPAMEFKTHVVNINDIQPGTAISYGATFVADRPMKVATLSVGYADGYKRSLSNKGRVLIRGQYAPILGRVCMDQMMVDVTHIDGVQVEDVATLFGRDGDKIIPVEEIADMAYSFNYEYVCSIAERVKRIYEA